MLIIVHFYSEASLLSLYNFANDMNIQNEKNDKSTENSSKVIPVLSEYAKSLESRVEERYSQKISVSTCSAHRRLRKEEMDQLYAKLNQCKIKAVALSLIDPFAEQFIDQSRSVPVVSELFHTDNLSLGYSELWAKCIQVQLKAEQVKLVEGTTRAQSKGTSFFKHRAGRIGASISGAVFHTNLSLPSQSLIKTICYPDLYKLNITAVKHGCKHEDAVIQAYETVMKKSHTNFQVKKSGLFINLALSGALRDM